MKRPHTPELTEHVPNKHIRTPQKAEVKSTLKKGASYRDVYKDTKIPKRTQQRIKASTTARTEPREHHRRGKIDEDTTQKMIRSLHGSYHHRCWTWEELRKDFKLECKWTTVRTTMNAHGYHKCRACQKSWISDEQAQKRLGWSIDKQHWPEWQWKQVHWSDECHFHQNSRHTDWVIRNKSERYCGDCVQKRRRTAASQFSVWAMVGYNYKSKLVFYSYTEDVDKEFKNGNVRTQKQKFGGSMTQERYRAEILPIVRRRKNELEHIHGQHMIFQEDNDGSHGTRSSENCCVYYKDEIELDYIDDWPPNSPDLNPIENVWRLLKSRVKLHHSMSHQQLRRAIEKEWKKITHDEINAYIFGTSNGKDRAKGGSKTKDCHIQNRIDQCIERKGLSTKY